MVEIIPTCVPKSAEDLQKAGHTISAFARSIHIDIDDDIFTPVLTWPYVERGKWKEFELGLTGFEIHMHLMTDEPRELGIAFARAGAHSIIGHLEGFSDTAKVPSTLDDWRSGGAKEAGLGVLMHTPLEVLHPLVPSCDFIHFMSIATVGTQGIPYDSRAPARIAEFHTRYPEMLISVDGGVSVTNISDLTRAGATRFGVGSAIMKSEDPKAAYEALKAAAENALQ